MDLRLAGKTALVTGSTSGIGFAVAKELLEEGVQVTICGRSQAKLDEAIAALKAFQPQAIVEGKLVNFENAASINSLIETMQPIDILVNNIGVFQSKSFDNTTDIDWEHMFQVNVMSGVRLSRHFLPQMILNNWGRIVFVSSECAQLVPADLIAYSATKAALLAISRGLAQTTKSTEVTVNAVLPGSTFTEGAKRFIAEQAQQQHKSDQQVIADFFKSERPASMLARFASVEEISKTIVYLTSPLALATNGATIKLDGGSVGGIV